MRDQFKHMTGSLRLFLPKVFFEIESILAFLYIRIHYPRSKSVPLESFYTHQRLLHESKPSQTQRETHGKDETTLTSILLNEPEFLEENIIFLDRIRLEIFRQGSI